MANPFKLESNVCSAPYQASKSRPDAEILTLCPEIAKTYSEYKGKELGIGFASEYAGNASSLFGHVFLVFINPDNFLNSKTISFLASTESEKNIFKYIWKGLAGGFTAHYKILPFYQIESIYSKIESRNISVFKFKNQNIDLLKLIYYLTENYNRPQRYYFFTKNCTSGLTDLISVAYNKHMPSHFIDYPIYALTDHTKNILLYKTIQSKESLLYNSSKKISRDRIQNIKFSIKHGQMISSTTKDEDDFLDYLSSYLTYKSQTVPQHNKILNHFSSNLDVKGDQNSSSLDWEKYPSRIEIASGVNESKLFNRMIFSPTYKDIIHFRIGDYTNNKMEIAKTELTQYKSSLLISNFKFIDMETNTHYMWPSNKISWRLLFDYDYMFNFKGKFQNINLLNTYGVTQNFKNGFINLLLGPRVMYLNTRDEYFFLSNISSQFVYEIFSFKIMSQFNLSGQPFTQEWTDKDFNLNLTYVLKSNSISLNAKNRVFRDETNNEVSLAFSHSF